MEVMEMRGLRMHKEYMWEMMNWTVVEILKMK